MTPSFEFFFSFYGLLLGLSAVEVAKGLANALGVRERIRIGWLTPLLAAFVLLDITSFWLFAWGGRAGDDRLHFPVRWPDHRDHLLHPRRQHWSSPTTSPPGPRSTSIIGRRKRLVVAGIMLPNAIVSLALRSPSSRRRSIRSASGSISRSIGGAGGFAVHPRQARRPGAAHHPDPAIYGQHRHSALDHGAGAPR